MTPENGSLPGENGEIAQAHLQAQRMIADAQRDSQQLKRDAERYAQQVLSDLENELSRALSVIRNGRQFIAQRRRAAQTQAAGRD